MSTFVMGTGIEVVRGYKFQCTVRAVADVDRHTKPYGH